MVRPTYKNIENTFDRYFYTTDLVTIKRGLVSVQGDCQIGGGVYLKELPCHFETITGNFKAANTGLTTLKGIPKTVVGLLDISTNSLTSLEGLSEKMMYLWIYNNPLTSIEPIYNRRTIRELYLNVYPNVPLLRLISMPTVFRFFKIDTEEELGNISNLFNRCREDFMNVSKKKAVVDCQKGLMAAGYVGNALW
jgi:hypothetical protein